MILPPRPIDVSRVLGALRMLVDLGYLEVPSGEDVFEFGRSREALDQSRMVFVEYVEDNADREGDLRYGLGWLLNQPDDVLEPLLVAARMPFPTRDIAARRRHLEGLWDAAFASWRTSADAVADAVVEGLPDQG